MKTFSLDIANNYYSTVFNEDGVDIFVTTQTKISEKSVYNFLYTFLLISHKLVCIGAVNVNQEEVSIFTKLQTAGQIIPRNLVIPIPMVHNPIWLLD